MASKPKATGRKVREQNFEALAMINQAKKHTVAMRESLYLVLLRDDVPAEAKAKIIDALHEADLAQTAADEVIYWLTQNEMIFADAAKRGTYQRADHDND